MHDYLAPGWKEILRHNRLDSFDAIWAVKTEWFEQPNMRRGGWSGVVRLEVKHHNGEVEALFVKRQKNHLRRTIRHPLTGEPTFKGEINNILRLQQIGVPTLEQVYYAQRKIEAHWCAILITRELKGFQPLDRVMEIWLERGWELHLDERRRLIRAAACLIRQLHNHRLFHGALYPKLFLSVSTEIGIRKSASSTWRR